MKRKLIILITALVLMGCGAKNEETLQTQDEIIQETVVQTSEEVEEATPAPTATPVPTVKPTAEPVETPESTIEPTQTPVPTPASTPEPKTSPTPEPVPTAEPTPEPTSAPTAEPVQNPPTDNAQASAESSQNAVPETPQSPAETPVPVETPESTPEAPAPTQAPVEAPVSSCDHTWPGGTTSEKLVDYMDGCRHVKYYCAYCTVCGEEVYHGTDLSFWEHDIYTVTETATTCVMNGSYTDKCYNCDYTYSYTPQATGVHTFSNGSCTGCGMACPHANSFDGWCFDCNSAF